MTNAPERVGLASLPQEAQAELMKFLFAYRLPESGRFVIRHVDPTTRLMNELEFDAQLARFLSPNERLQVRTAGERKSYVLPGLVAWVAYQIHPERRTLVAHFDVFESDSGQKFIEVDQEVYSPTPWEPVAVISKAVERARFPQEYASWDEERRAGYWAVQLHRMRRWSGEAGHDENAAFTPRLLQEMQRIDPKLRAILPEILRLVAELGQEDPQQLELTFIQRTGLGPATPA